LVYVSSDRSIAANLLSEESGMPLFKPYVINSISLPGNPRKFRLGFIGLSSRHSYIPTDESGYVWAGPLVSARKWLPELRQQCDFVIALACMPAKDAVQLAVDTSNIDIILTGFKHQGSGLPAT